MRALKRLRASKRLLRRRHTAQRRRAARGLAVTAVVAAVTMVLTSVPHMLPPVASEVGGARLTDSPH